MNGDNNRRLRAKRRAGVLDQGACSLQPGPKRSKQARNLSEDLIKSCILPRLPTKALVRFQCVSRSWHSLISSDPYFIHLHLHSQSSIFSSFLLVDTIAWGANSYVDVDFISRDPRSSSKPSLHFPGKMKGRPVSASCNGLLCLNLEVEDARKKLYIGNPILGDWRLLPPHHHGDRHSTVFYGLAVDVEKSGVSYKLVLPERLRNDDGVYITNEAIFHVLSSRSGQWEVSKYKLDDVYECWPPHERAAYVNGVLYWICWLEMLWFDVKDGRCGLFPLPPNTFKNPNPCGLFPLPPNNPNPWRGGAVGECNGELTYTRVAGREGRMEIWSRADQSSSWTKIHNFILHVRYVTPMPFEGGNVVFFRVHEGHLFSYDTETGVVERNVYESHIWQDFIPYKHCLTPLPSL